VTLSPRIDLTLARMSRADLAQFPGRSLGKHLGRVRWFDRFFWWKSPVRRAEPGAFFCRIPVNPRRFHLRFQPLRNTGMTGNAMVAPPIRPSRISKRQLSSSGQLPCRESFLS
jgi:hypothetical protein